MDDTSDILTLARTIYGEARSETRAGRIAVAHVIRNRYMSQKWFGGSSIAEVCLRPLQFSCWNDHHDFYENRVAMMRATLSEKAFAECLEIACGVMTGSIPDNTSGSCHYHNSKVQPAWAVGHTSVATIGTQIFYSGID